MSYATQYAQSIDQPEQFWREKALKLPWYTSPATILTQDEQGLDRWFCDGQLNTSYMALDHHVKNGNGEKTALIYDSPVTGQQQKYSYQQLLTEVSLFAGVLHSKGIKKGDLVVIYMPMIPQAAIAMLAVARLGAIHSVVFGGFAAPELAIRIDDAKPKLIVCASCGIEVNRVVPYKPLVDEAIDLAKFKPQHCIVIQRQQCKAELQEARDFDYHELMAKASPHDAVPVLATDPLYILYTSGTTGKPKGVVRDNGGHAVAMHYSMKAIYGLKQDDVFWAASDVGWVVGHSYIVYGPLILGSTTVMFEGKPIMTPDAGAFWRMIEQYKINVLFAAPTAFRAIKKNDPDGKLIAHYDLSSLRTIFMAGERLDPPTYAWTRDRTNKPVIDHWWQTETGWAISANPMGVEQFPVKPGSSTKPSPGFSVEILDENGDAVATGQQGAICIRRPLPPGCLPTIWGDDQRFIDGYLTQNPGYYTSGDGGYFDEDGYLFVMGRTDDVINTAGHRLSTGEMEEVVARHPAVAECCVIGVNDALKGQLPVGLVLLKDGVDVEPLELQAQLVKMVRDDIGPIACFKTVLIAQRLPKTRSGKILRKLLRQIADGHAYSVPSTIDDPDSIAEIAQLLEAHGLIQTSEPAA